MRKVRSLQFLLVILCLGLAAIVLHLRPADKIHDQKAGLTQALAHINNWKQVSVIPLDPIIVDELKLDDFVFQSYSKDTRDVDLYVGYYFSSAKVGAAHDPLVCFPGGGWQVSGSQSGSILLTDDSNYKINYSSLLAEKNDEKVLVYYWYQAGNQATSGTFFQKILLLRSKFMNQNENNAFVRISTTLKDESIQEGQERITTFIKDFYPVFHNYIVEL